MTRNPFRAVALSFIMAWLALTRVHAEPEVRAREQAPAPASPLGDAFGVPKDIKDAYGNPIREGRDEKTGWPLEIWHRATGMHFVFVPAGEFVMGSPADEKERGNNEAQHRVTQTKPFYLGKHEVTQAEWKKVTGNSPSNLKGDRNPVEKVSWDDCQEFIKKLSTSLRSPSSGLTSSKAGRGAWSEGRAGHESSGRFCFGLPTEAQWEYACRAGATTRFSFGDRDDHSSDYAWYFVNANRKTHPVGQKKPNAWGLYDMHGNVWEWCDDRYGEYATGSVKDTVGPSSGVHRVFRGGSWYTAARYCRAAFRGWDWPRSRNIGRGLRLAFSPF